MDFTEGYISVFKRHLSSIIGFYCKINGMRTLVEGKIINKPGQAVVDWSLHPLELLHLKRSKK